MRKLSLSLLLVLGFLLSPFIATDFTHSTIPSKNFYAFYADGYFWTYDNNATPATELKAYDANLNYVKTYYYPKRYYIGSDIYENVAFSADRTNGILALINLTNGDVYANMSVPSIFTPSGIFHIRNDIYWFRSYTNRPQMMVDLNGTLLSSATYTFEFSIYENEYAYLFSKNWVNYSYDIRKLDLTGSTIVDLGVNAIDLGGSETDYFYNLGSLNIPSGYGDYRLFYTQEPGRNYMQVMTYSLSTNSVIDTFITSASFLKNVLTSTSIYNSAQNIFYDILIKDIEGDLIITSVNATSGEIIDVVEKSIYGLTDNENIVKYFNTLIIPVDTGDDAISFLMTIYTKEDIEDVMMIRSTAGATHNVDLEYVLVETNGSSVKATQLYTSPYHGDWFASFQSQSATNGRTVVVATRVDNEQGISQFQCDVFDFSSGSIWDEGLSVQLAGLGRYFNVSVASYGNLNQADTELKESPPLIFGHNDVIADGNCSADPLQFRPILNSTYNSLEMYFFVMNESVSCINGWTVYNRTGNDFFYGIIGLADVRAINYSGVASNLIMLLTKICSNDVCKIAEWQYGISRCTAIPVITYPIEGNISRTGDLPTINAQVSLVDAYENCSLTSYTAGVYLNSEFVGNKTNADSSIQLSVPDDDTSYLVEAKAVAFPNYYFSGSDDSVNFTMIISPAFVPEYEAEDIFPQIIDIFAGIGNEIADNSIAIGGLLFLGLTVVVVAWVSFKKKK